MNRILVCQGRQVRDRAIAAGWNVAGPPMCNRCRRPVIAKGLT